ncbi:MAG: Vms1/Ankzf1 family peptidyl-tRNA hydrolase [Thermoanaerobacterales bacterium]|nr:Vms1/Ankzf1 family peptidyl-tRNA hydrolase [Thermoanaerobacterales bacterium]
MLTREEVSELMSLPDREYYYCSLYLDVDPATNPRAEYVTRLKNLLRDAVPAVEDREQRYALAYDLERLANYVALARSDFKKGLAIIACGPLGVWREYHLAIPVRDVLVIDQRPYLKPLFALLDDHQPYVIVLVDRRSARLFLVQLGEVVEYTEASRDDIPGKHKKGGWFALSQTRYARHIEYHVDRHLEGVADLLQTMLSSGYIGRIAIAGPVEAVSRFRSFLPAEAESKILTFFKEETVVDRGDLLTTTQSVMSEVERAMEDQFVEEITAAVAEGGRAVIGLDDVAFSAVQGRIRKLAVTSGYQSGGYRCQDCGQLFTTADGDCPFCNGMMEEIPRLVDLVVQMAADQGALVEVVRQGHPALARAGYIGAILRY